MSNEQFKDQAASILAEITAINESTQAILERIEAGACE